MIKKVLLASIALTLLGITMSHAADDDNIAALIDARLPFIHNTIDAVDQDNPPPLSTHYTGYPSDNLAAALFLDLLKPEKITAMAYALLAQLNYDTEAARALINDTADYLKETEEQNTLHAHALPAAATSAAAA